jgi:hypothetical protein
MARLQDGDRGNGLQIWRVAANIFNKQSRTADNGRSSSLEVGLEANNSSLKEISLLLNARQGLLLELILWNELIKGKEK